MSKVLKSTIEGWEGTVTIADPLFLPQSLALRKAIREIGKLGKKALLEEIMILYLPAVFDCVEGWDIKGKEQPTVETFPFVGTDEKNSIEFAGWLYKELVALYKVVEDDNPNP